MVWSGGVGLGLQLGAQLLGAPLVDQLRQRLHGLDAHLPLRPRHEGQQGVDQLRVAELAQGAHHDRRRLGGAGASASPCSRGTARLLPISASASTARSLTHQSVIARGLDE